MLGEAFEDVLAAAQAGGAWAFSRLYEDLAGVVTAYLRRQGAAEPDDLTSETFLQVFRGLGAFAGDESGFRSWVFTIAHRRLVDERRRRGRRPPEQSLDPHETDVAAAMAEAAAPAADVAVLAAAAADELGAHLDQLSDAQRDVVLLRVVAGLTTAETAAALGRRESTVRQQQRRGLQALAASLAGARSPR